MRGNGNNNMWSSHNQNTKKVVLDPPKFDLDDGMHKLSNDEICFKYL